MQLSAIRTISRSFVNEPVAGYFTDAELTSWINVGYHLLESETEYTENVKTDKTVKYQQEYSLPSDCYKASVVYWEDDPLDEMDWEEYIREKGSQNLTQYSNPERVIYWNKKLYLYPTPASASSETTIATAINASANSLKVVSTTDFPEFGRIKAGSEIIGFTNKSATKFSNLTRGLEGSSATSHATAVTVYERDISIVYYGMSTDLSADADAPNIPSQYHILLAYYAAWIGLLKSKSIPEAREFERLFKEGMQDMKRQLRLSSRLYRSIKDANVLGLERP